MNEIISFKNGELAKEAIQYIAEIERQFKEAKEKEEAMKKALLEAMEKGGLVKFENDFITLTYIAPTESERLDTKAFKENCPDLYNEFVKFSPVKASIRIKVK